MKYFGRVSLWCYVTDICYFSYLGEQPIGLQGFEYVAKLDLSGRPRFKLVINDSFDNDDFSDELVEPLGRQG